MTVFDYLVFGIVGVSLLLGAWRGIVSELLALVAWIAAFFVARELGKPVASLLSGLLADPMIRLMAGYILVFIIVLLLVAMLRFLLRELLKAVGLGFVDRLLGATFGIARGAAVVILFVILGGMTALPKQAWWRDSVTAAPIETLVIAGKPWLPPDIAARIRFH